MTIITCSVKAKLYFWASFAFTVTNDILSIALTAPSHHCTIAPLHHRTTAPSHHCTIAPLHHCTIAPLHHCTIAPLYHRTTVPSHHCTTAPSHHCTYQDLYLTIITQLVIVGCWIVLLKYQALFMTIGCNEQINLQAQTYGAG